MLREGTGKGAAVICHPHPLYGGSMWNNVVDAMEEGFFQAGFATLRFNFRGVGGSTGRHDGGAGEMRDAAAACLFLKEQTGGDGRFVLAGYSFGAWVCARATSGSLPTSAATSASALWPIRFPCTGPMSFALFGERSASSAGLSMRYRLSMRSWPSTGSCLRTNPSRWSLPATPSMVKRRRSRRLLARYMGNRAKRVERGGSMSFAHGGGAEPQQCEEAEITAFIRETYGEG